MQWGRKGGCSRFIGFKHCNLINGFEEDVDNINFSAAVNMKRELGCQLFRYFVCLLRFAYF